MSQVVGVALGTQRPVDGIVTGIWPLADWRKALATASAGPAPGASKQSFDHTWIYP